MLKAVKSIRERYDKFCAAAIDYIDKNGNSALFLLGCTLLVIGLVGLAEAQSFGNTTARPGFDPWLIEGAVGNLFLLIEGAFGALIMVVAGIGAIFAAAMGAYRPAVGMLIVAVGSFILRALVSLFFGGGFDPIQDIDN